MKKIKTYFNKTSIIDSIEIQTGGPDPGQDVAEQIR